MEACRWQHALMDLSFQVFCKTMMQRYRDKLQQVTQLANPVQVIQQDRPCHLYLDLEYSKPCNPGLDGDEAVEALIKILADAVKYDPKIPPFL